MQLTIRLLRETDGRWIADIPELPGVTVYGSTPDEATVRAKALALRVIAEELENGEMKPGPIRCGSPLPRERMACDQGAESARSFAADWIAGGPDIRFPPDAAT
jgi:predicted RNase H-like HicB family nuclease